MFKCVIVVVTVDTGVVHCGNGIATVEVEVDDVIVTVTLLGSGTVITVFIMSLLLHEDRLFLHSLNGWRGPLFVLTTTPVHVSLVGFNDSINCESLSSFYIHMFII